MHFRWPTLVIAILAANGVAQNTALRPSPADQSIAFAKSEIERNPSKSNPYSELAMAYVSKARETSDKTCYDKAQAAVEKSFSLSVNNFEARKAQVAVLLGKHEAVEALAEAQKLNHEVPDDVIVYGYVADSGMWLGNYDEAEKAAQWMLDIRPHNIPGLIRGFELRRVFGDPDGAIEFLTDAYQQTLPDQVEDLAFFLTQMAALDLAMGKVELAEQLSDKALNVFPDYYLTLETLADIRNAQGRYMEAAELLRKRNGRFPTLKSLYAQAEALDLAGKSEEAKPLYGDFEQRARSAIPKTENANRELVFYYLHHQPNPAEAKRIATLEIARRHDVFTLDAYASALYATADYAEARKQIEKALATGIRDASILYHAAMISSKLNDNLAAHDYLERSLQLNPASPVSARVREMLVKSSSGASLKQ